MKIALVGRGYWGSKIRKYTDEFFETAHYVGCDADLRTIWKDRSVKGVIIATPIETHFDLARDAIRAGKHVLVEKPVALRHAEAVELAECAVKAGVKIGVEYTQMFAPSVVKALSLAGERIGGIEYVEMATRHLGRFMDQSVYWLLASHHLSILDLISPLEDLYFTRTNLMNHEGVCTAGIITFYHRGGYPLRGTIMVNSNYPGKDMSFAIYGEQGSVLYNAGDHAPVQCVLHTREKNTLPDGLITEVTRYHEFDERNNLRHSMRYFRDLVKGDAPSNMHTAIQITRILEELDGRGN